MGRCTACYSVITKRDSACYVCGEKLPRHARVVPARKQLTWVNNVLFMISLGVTGFSFFSNGKMPLSLSIAVSCTLLALRLVADRFPGQAEGNAVVARTSRSQK